VNVMKELVVRLSASEAGLCKIADMYVAFTQMGKGNDIEAVLAEVFASEQVGQLQPEKVENKSDNGLQTGVFRVLEARETPSGAIRAYCQAEDGNKVAVFGKNGIGKTLIASIEKEVKIEYRKGDKGLIAIKIL